ncbi:jerky protein homolog-like [Uranotaenia lowii]|uniref:jerky protein homolog-like n=1 Tax=Uranotaenia lowii TaxID=190385 RepID=UPI0024791FA6|nr:jerky protein homolog-like [Uranotaenia lowii]
MTFMPCANADGSYKLPLMLIRKSKRPRALKNVRELPVYYASSKNAWMTRQLFKDWFFNEFVPKVTAFLEGANLPVTARLVLDSTTFLPPNTIALLQPMDQNVIQMVKSNYKQKLMCELLGRQGEFDDMVKRIDIKDAMFWVAEAWDGVPAESIAKSWKLLYPETEFDDDDDIPLSVEEDMEFDVLNDDDIVNVVLNPNTSFYDGKNTVSTVEGENALSVLEPHQNDMDDEAGSSVSHETALSGIDQVITWAEENGLPLECQFLLREVRGNVLEKTMDSRNVNV